MTVVGVTGHQQLPHQAIPQIKEQLRYELSELGRLTSYRYVGDGMAAVFDFTLPPESWTAGSKASAFRSGPGFAAD